MIDTATLRARIIGLKFNEITALAKRLRDPLGFDPNRKFARPMKESFADWILAEFDAHAVSAALDAEPLDAEPEPMPAPSAPPPAPPRPAGATSDQAGAVAGAIAAALGGMKFGLQDHEVRALAHEVATTVAKGTLGEAATIAEAAAAKAIAEATIPRPITVVRKERDSTTEVPMGMQHKQFGALLQLCAVRGVDGFGLNVWLAGPAGSGKTTAARNVAKALDLPFHFNGAVDTEYKLLGFTDAQGRVVSRPFREAFEKGGVYLFDECDASLPGALLAFNAATSNGTCDFPDGNIARHPDCIIIAAANTFGNGATNEYVGRMKQDAAFMDRFVTLNWGYDETLEKAISGNPAWASKVQRVRKAVSELGIKHIVSPRATYSGAAMLAAGIAESDVIEMTVRKGLNDDHWKQVRSKANL